MEKKEREKTKNNKQKTTKPKHFIFNRLGRGSFSSQRRGIRYFCLFTETKWQTFRWIPGFYSTSGTVDYMAVIFCAHLVDVKCEIFTTTSTREIQLCARPATQLTCSHLLPANFTRKSIAHARKSKWKGSMGMKDIREISGSRGVNGTETVAGI